MQSHQVLWKVGLSNGETVRECAGLFQEILGELSPWQKLQAHLKEAGLKITSLRLTTKDGRTFNLPSAGMRDPHFHAFHGKEPPIELRCWRRTAHDVGHDDENALFTVAEAIYPNHRTQLWVNEYDTRDCWVLTETDP